ncbi:MAG: D-glycero-alpha-D-manno-heptose 1-phosphate guanylyltransferase [Syntrophus sp. PtaU1.Bin208]|nr:MAG: D-glycero-alpha-D-manno-heptose 1-phosphate guanylyltransferase [Syntrophus sp. PtaU1.Bin208]
MASNINAFVLAGGFGTRLRSVVPDRQKVGVEIGGRPFLTYLFDQLIESDIRKVIIGAGYRGNELRELVGDAYGPLRLVYSIEQEPLGTAGALRLAAPLIHSDPVLVLNGDSYCRFELEDFMAFHSAKAADASILLTPMEDTSRYGRVLLDGTDRVVRFEEKGFHKGEGWINAGVYLLGASLIRSIPVGRAVSLEREIFPSLTALFGLRVPGPFLDIGTPEDYARAAAFFSRELGLRNNPPR